MVLGPIIPSPEKITSKKQLDDALHAMEQYKNGTNDIGALLTQNTIGGVYYISTKSEAEELLKQPVPSDKRVQMYVEFIPIEQYKQEAERRLLKRNTRQYTPKKTSIFSYS